MLGLGVQEPPSTSRVRNCGELSVTPTLPAG